MASSLIGGLLAQGDIAATDIMLFDPNTSATRKLADEYGIVVSSDNQSLVLNSDVVIIAVKPQVLQSVLEAIAVPFKEKQPLTISIAAGITIDSIERWLDGDYPVVRVMPNTPALIGKGASGLYANQRVSQAQRELAESLISSVGCAVWVNNEGDIDSVTALSGSGPAYFMLFIQGLIEAAERAGLDSDTAKTLAVQTAAGAAELVASSDASLQTLIDNVTSPNGTTEQGLQSFAKDDLKGTVQNAFNAAKQRSVELAKELA